MSTLLAIGCSLPCGSPSSVGLATRLSWNGVGTVNFSQLAIPVNTRNKKVTHVIGHDVDWLCHGRLGFWTDSIGSSESALLSFSLRFGFRPLRLAATFG